MARSHIPSLAYLPTPALLCNSEGVVLYANKKADALMGRAIEGENLDRVIDFSKTDLSMCSTFKQASLQIQGRSEELNVLSVQYDHSPVSHLNLYFSFFQGSEGEDAVLIVLQNATERVKLLDAFEYKQNLLDNIVTTSTDALIVFDDYGCIELFSPAAETLFGKTSTEMIIEDIYSLFGGVSQGRIKDIIDRLKRTEANSDIIVCEDLSPINAEGETFPASITFSRSQKDTQSLFFMVVSDKSLFQKFVNSVNDAYIKTDDLGRIIDANNKAEDLFQVSREALINKHISLLEIRNSKSQVILSDIHKLESSDHEEDYIALNRRGEEVTLNITVWPQEVNNIRLNNLIIRDISQKKLAERQLFNTAFTDSLTNLSNRANFNKKLSERIEIASKADTPFALLAIDLDKFKVINDTFGHDYGDELLKVSAVRLAACVRNGDIVSRMGGDEFTVIIQEIENRDYVAKIAERILRSFRREFNLKEKRVTISSSIGAAIFPDDGCTPEDLYKAADMALYAAKRAGKDMFRRFTMQMRQEHDRVQFIERALANAIAKNELSLSYQPKVSFANANVVGFEALLRWNNPELGQISPVEFIPIAEETGYIVELTRWVLTQAIRQMKYLAENVVGMRESSLTLAVNISADHFRQNLYSDVQEIISKEAYDPSLLEIEITEGVLLEHSDEVVEVLRRLRSLGVHISLDDFGTGYSSLQYLKHFTLNTIKVDRSFVRDIHKDSHNNMIVESIISIADRLNMNLVVEGVETSSEINHLVALGCDVFQGYFYSRPIPEDDVLAFLNNAEAIVRSLHNKFFSKIINLK